MNSPRTLFATVRARLEGRPDSEHAQALVRLITKLGPLPPIGDLRIGEVLEAIRRDKKVVDGKLHFVIAIQIGAAMTIDDVTEDELKAVLERLGLRA